MVLDPPQSWIENYLMHMLQYFKYIFIVIVPHIVFIIDLAELQDVGDTYLAEP